MYFELWSVYYPLSVIYEICLAIKEKYICVYKDINIRALSILNMKWGVFRIMQSDFNRSSKEIFIEKEVTKQ